MIRCMRGDISPDTRNSLRELEKYASKRIDTWNLSAKNNETISKLEIYIRLAAMDEKDQEEILACVSKLTSEVSGMGFIMAFEFLYCLSSVFKKGVKKATPPGVVAE